MNEYGEAFSEMHKLAMLEPPVVATLEAYWVVVCVFFVRMRASVLLSL